MLQLPIDCIIIITHFLPDKSKINLTHANKFLHSLQKFITLTNTPVYPDTKLKFQFRINYWFPLYPDPKTKYVIVKRPKRDKFKSAGDISLPQNYHELKSLIFKCQLRDPLPTFENLTTLEFDYAGVDPLTLPVTLTCLKLSLWYASITNLHELKDLEYSTIKASNLVNLTANLDDHPKLKEFSPFGNNINIKISKLHENLESLSGLDHGIEIDITLIPNLTTLHANIAYGDLNLLTKLRCINVTEVVGPKIDLGNFKDLENCSISKCGYFVSESNPCNVQRLKLTHIGLVTDELFPRLVDLTISYSSSNDEIVISHNKINMIYLKWAGSVKFVNADSLEILYIVGENMDCLNQSTCDFKSLRRLGVESESGELLILNMDKMKKLEIADYESGDIRLLGESDALMEIGAIRVDGAEEDVMGRFKNLRVWDRMWRR